MKVSRSEPGFVVSSVAHAGLLLAALVLFTDTAKFDDAVEMIPAEVITDAELNQVTKGEKAARIAPPKSRVDKVARESETKTHLPLAEAKKDTPAPPQPLRRLTDPGEDDTPPTPPKRVAALPPAPEPKKVEPKPEPKKAEPNPETKVDPKLAPQPPAKAKAAPEKDDDEPKEAKVVKPKPPVKQKAEPAKEPPKPETAKEAPKEPPKTLDKNAMKELLKEQAKETLKAAPEKPKAESRLKADEVAKLLDSKNLADKASEGEESDKSNKASKPKSGDESAPKSKFDASSISKMLSREEPQRRAATGEKTQTAALGASTGAAPKLSTSMEARIASYIHDHYHPCWASALSLGGATFAPVIEFHLSREGALQGSPRLVNGSADPVERARGEQALQAVRRCSPMRIPPEFAPYYEEALHEVTIRFQDAN